MKIKIENVKIAKEENFDIKKSGWQLQLTAKVCDQYIDNLYFDFGKHCLDGTDTKDDNLFLLMYNSKAGQYLNEILNVMDKYVSQAIGLNVEFENKELIIDTLLNSEFSDLFFEFKKYNQLAAKLFENLKERGFYEKKH